ncbi:hypothetical protein ERX35_000010 [Macrococcus equipercicus]|uniref:DUF2357 domain-containing protein n=1 Tax=Macrococcus equipercicus TaxID=69967 RepID=A0ABQ6RAR7_9STAP|nr:nuclease domain-containing protein [Macrococcus equipercicus]KAA1042302.1 hypothetical protein ERX35_000010 [Macrococcus equipercicus]
MAMLSKVSLISQGNSNELIFTDDIKSVFLQENNILTINEYYDLSVLFTSNNNKSRLYLDGLDLSSSSRVLLDKDGDYYIYPSNEKVSIIDKQINFIENILVPGYYMVTLVEDDQKYYSTFEISPKSLSKPQWIAMKDEIEETLIGLSTSFNRRNVTQSSTNSNNLYYKIDFIKTMYKKYIITTRQLVSRPIYKLEKTYEWKDVSQNPIVDGKSIRKKLEKPEKQQQLYSPNRVLNYNSNENQWLKSTILKINKINFEYLNYFRSRLELLDSEIKKNTKFVENLKYLEKERLEILHITEILKKINAANSLLLKQEWMQSLEINGIIYPSSKMMMNSNYNFYYQWLKKMKTTESQVFLPNSIQYTWKRTDVLFEIWTYIKFMKILEELKFIPIDGWIYSTNYKPIPDLLDGTMIKYKKNEVELNLHYNTRIKEKSSSTIKDNPLHTKVNNNKPDIRLDVFYQNFYIGSLIIDTKYRSLRKIIEGNSEYKEHSMVQLRNYKNSPDSKTFFYPELISSVRELLKPIKNVWVFYPHSDEQNYPQKKVIEEDEGIYFYEISPNNSTEYISKSLSNLIDSLIDSYNRLSKLK